MTCTEPGCRRRVMVEGGKCYLHRPANPRRNDGNRKGHDAAYRERQRRLRAAAGLAPGMEGEP